MRPEILHVLDLATLRDWDGAKAAIEDLDDPAASRLFALVSELDHYEDRRRKADTHLRHEIGNALSIVRANLEGIIDGVLPATPERLTGMREALTEASALLDDLRQHPERPPRPPSPPERFDLATMIDHQYSMLAELAEAKSVSVLNAADGSVLCDAGRCSHLLRNVLAGSIRFAPPGGNVEIRPADEPGELIFRIRGLRAGTAAPRALLRGQGIHNVTLRNDALTFLVRLPGAPDGD
jgi:signal transduction histidine kinase